MSWLISDLMISEPPWHDAFMGEACAIIFSWFKVQSSELMRAALCDKESMDKDVIHLSI